MGKSRMLRFCPREIPYLLKVLKESGALTDKNLEHIRAANLARARKYSLTDRIPLIAELDGLIMNMVRWNAENEI
jgi:hypothetical protein